VHTHIEVFADRRR